MLGASKLKVEQVKEIKKLFVQNLNDSEIAKMYGVSRPLINMIRNGNRWPEEKEKIKLESQFRSFQITGNQYQIFFIPVQTLL